MASRDELHHAMQYAQHETCIYMFSKYQDLYPDWFQHAAIQMRPATPDDYYLPAALKDSCRVVDGTTFNRKGCSLSGCFPFKALGEPCQPTDPLQWTQVGNTFSLSCQPLCASSDTTVDTEWWDGRCVMVNPYKKMVVMFPESVFQRPDRNTYHGGLTWDRGQVALNARYCEAYGLLFDGRDCLMTGGQRFGEIMLGTTVFRNLKTAHMQPVAPIVPPAVPTYFQPVEAPVSADELTDTSLADKVAQDIMVDLAADLGMDIGLHVVQNILKKRVPQLVAKASTHVAFRAALQQAVLKNAAAITTKAFVAMGRTVSSFATVFGAFSLVSVIVDVVDPQMYNYLLTADMVDKLNQRLDWQYFQKEANFNQTVTPEYVWDYVLPPQDQSDQYLFFAQRVKDYLTALRPEEKVSTPPKSTFTMRRTMKKWTWTLHGVLVGMTVLLAIMWIQWIHVWVCVVFFFLVRTK